MGGFDWVFVTPSSNRAPRAAFYSIADYFRINPALLDPQSSAPPKTKSGKWSRKARPAA